MQTTRRHFPPSNPCHPDARCTSSRRLRAAGAVLLGLLLAACGGGGSDGTTATVSTASAVSAASAATTPAAMSSNIDAASALEQLNAARAVARTCGTTLMPAVAPLRWNAALEQAAVGHSEWMQANNTFSHTGADGSTVGPPAPPPGDAGKMVGDDKAAGARARAGGVAAWLESEGHCRNIMHPDFVDVALALKPGTSSNTYRTWWTLDFGRPL